LLSFKFPVMIRTNSCTPVAASLLFLIFTLSTTALSAGEPDDITLQAVTGEKPFVLSEHRGSFVALHFLLKTECPVCIRHTWDYSEHASELPDVVQVFIKPDTEKEIADWIGNLPDDGTLSFPIYRDPDAALAEKLGIPGGYEFHGQVVHYPALVLLDPQGEEIFRYVGENNRDRYGVEQLKEKIKELSGE